MSLVLVGGGEQDDNFGQLRDIGGADQSAVFWDWIAQFFLESLGTDAVATYSRPLTPDDVRRRDNENPSDYYDIVILFGRSTSVESAQEVAIHLGKHVVAVDVRVVDRFVRFMYRVHDVEVGQWRTAADPLARIATAAPPDELEECALSLVGSLTQIVSQLRSKDGSDVSLDPRPRLVDTLRDSSLGEELRISVGAGSLAKADKLVPEIAGDVTIGVTAPSAFFANLAGIRLWEAVIVRRVLDDGLVAVGGGHFVANEIMFAASVERVPSDDSSIIAIQVERVVNELQEATAMARERFRSEYGLPYSHRRHLQTRDSADLGHGGEEITAAPVREIDGDVDRKDPPSKGGAVLGERGWYKKWVPILTLVAAAVGGGVVLATVLGFRGTSTVTTILLALVSIFSLGIGFLAKAKDLSSKMALISALVCIVGFSLVLGLVFIDRPKEVEEPEVTAVPTTEEPEVAAVPTTEEPEVAAVPTTEEPEVAAVPTTAARLLATRVLIEVPERNAEVTSPGTLNCWFSSVAVIRPGAVRCATEDSHIYDPCFYDWRDETSEEVVVKCPGLDDPIRRGIVQPEAVTEWSNQSPEDLTDPWRFDLDDETSCSKLTGTTGIVGGIGEGTYHCSSAAGKDLAAIGVPDRDGDVWTILIGTYDDSAPVERRKIAIVWF